LPEGWEWKKLGEVCEVIPGQSPKSKFYNKNGEGVPFYQGKKEFTEKYIDSPKTWTTKITKEAKKDDVLMSVRAPVGPVNFATQKICIGRGLSAIRAGEKIDKNYLFYFFIKHKNEITGNNGAVFNSISRDQIKAIKIPLPSLAEQKRIVAILDEAFAAIDKAKANAEKNLANSKELFESYLNGIFANPREDWEEKKLGEILNIARGGSPRPIKSYITDASNGINWIKIGDVKPGTKYIEKTAQKIRPEGIKKSRFVEEGDFLLSNSMSFGRPYILKTSGCIHDGWLVLKKKANNIDKHYLFQVLGSKSVIDQFDSLAAGSTVRNLNTTLVSKVLIPLPSFQEQKRIVVKLDRLSAESEQLESIYQKKIVALDELKKSIFKKAFAGEL
jgi:type I restriction enzyme S subunit